MIAAVVSILVSGPAFAAQELTCEVQTACAHTEPCAGHGQDTPGLLNIILNQNATLTVDFGHRTAIFDRVVALENDAIFAHSIDTNNGRQEMLSLIPPGNLMLSIHNNLDVGVSITVFGICNRSE